MSAFYDGPCARDCGRRAFYWYSGPGRDQPEEWVCTACYQAEEFAPGHVLNGGRRHFMSSCRDCCARTLLNMTLEQVERWYHYGNVGQDVYEAYCYVWATSAYRYSACGSWREPPVIPEVVRLAEIMRGELAKKRECNAR